MKEMPLPEFDYQRCSACEFCVSVCPEGALVMIAGNPHFRPGRPCSYCGKCEESCPTGAISLGYEIVFGG